MKKGSTMFLRGVLGLVALVTLVIAIRWPQTEGRAQGLRLLEIYADPLIVYMYIATVLFFAGLYQAFRLLQLIEIKRAFSQEAVNRLRNIKVASFVLIGFIIFGLVYIRLFAHGDDPAGPSMLGMIVSLGLATIATAAGIFQKLCQNAVDLKSENDLTV